MSDNQFRYRWQEREPEASDQEIIKALRDGANPDSIKGLKTYAIHGVKYHDLSGMTIEGEVLDISHLSNIDFSHSRLVNVRFTSQTDLSSFRFESAELMNVSFKPINQIFDTRLILENFVFDGAKIERSDFSSNGFSGRNYFLNSKFHDVDFANTDFEKGIFCDFSRAKFIGCGFSGAVLNKSLLCKCLFSDCDLRGTQFEETNLADIAFKNCIVNSETTFDEKIVLERNESSEKAYETYIQIKNLFRNTGHFLESQKYYLREVNTRGKKEKSWIKRIFLLALANLAKVCYKPWQVFVWSLLIVSLFAGFYYLTGIGSFINNELVPDKNIFHCLYFSVVTFTTLGYGDLTPICGLSKVFASIEAFLGPASLTLFMATLIRKTIQE